MRKSMLVISRQSPLSGPSAREALDIALAGGAFELPLAMLFMDDGVFQLCGHKARLLEQKELSANLQALPLFGIDDLWVCARSLKERGLNSEQLALPATIVQPRELSALLTRFDHLVTL